MEHDDKEYEDKEEVLSELIKKYNFHIKKPEDFLIEKVAKEIHERCKISYREIAVMLEIGRERLRKIVSTPPSP